jgi:hypothetical protein
MDVYLRCYQASQRLITKLPKIVEGLDESEIHVKRLDMFNYTSATSDSIESHRKNLVEAHAVSKGLREQMDSFSEDFREYGLLPVDLVASNYVRAGVQAVEHALPATRKDFEEAEQAFRVAQQEMINRFRDDLDINDPSAYRMVWKVMRREMRNNRRTKHTAKVSS